MKSTFLVCVLLSASKAFADEQLRRLRGGGDPTPVDDTRYSKQDLVGQEEPYLGDASFVAETEPRELNAGRPVPLHHPHGASMSGRTRSNPHPRSVGHNHHHATNGHGPSHISRARPKHVQGSNPRAKQNMMMGGGSASRRYAPPEVREKANHARSHARQNPPRNSHPVTAAKKHQFGNGPRAIHGHGHPMHGAMGRSNGRQSRHNANTEGQGTIQHVGKPSHSAAGGQKATPSRHNARTEGQGTLQHVGKPSHSEAGGQNATRSTQGATQTTHGNHSFDSRIVGGFAADEGEYKFIATLYFGSSADSLSFGCGGSLIAPNMVLTAAHCGGESVSSVRIGSNSLTSGGELRGVASQCVHPMYDAEETSNDYMIVKLDSPMDTSEFPNIELNQDSSLPQEDDMLTVIGFGLTTDGGDVSQTLQKVEVPMNSHELCDQQYGGIIEEDIQFCAGFVEGGKDSCQGDSGGPIFEMRGSTPVQVGVVSFGEGCALPDRSGVYARVTGAYEWIHDTIAKLDAGDTSGCGGETSPGSDDNSFTLNDDGGVGSGGDDGGVGSGGDDGDVGSGGDDGGVGSGGDDGGVGSGGDDGGVGSGGDDGGWGSSGDDGWGTADDGGWYDDDDDSGWYYDDDGGWYYDDDDGWYW